MQFFSQTPAGVNAAQTTAAEKPRQGASPSDDKSTDRKDRKEDVEDFAALVTSGRANPWNEAEDATAGTAETAPADDPSGDGAKVASADTAPDDAFAQLDTDADDTLPPFDSDEAREQPMSGRAATGGEPEDTHGEIRQGRTNAAQLNATVSVSELATPELSEAALQASSDKPLPADAPRHTSLTHTAGPSALQPPGPVANGAPSKIAQSHPSAGRAEVGSDKMLTTGHGPGQPPGLSPSAPQQEAVAISPANTGSTVTAAIQSMLESKHGQAARQKVQDPASNGKIPSEVALSAVAKREARFDVAGAGSSGLPLWSATAAQASRIIGPPQSAALSLVRSNGASDSKGVASLLPTEPMTDMIWEPGRVHSIQHAQAASPLRGDIGQYAMRQIMDVIPSAGSKPVEIALSPHELGRVRLSVSAEDRSITVQIIAERPETLDLMRRHIDQLGASFRQMGYDSVAFSFGQGADGGQATSGEGQQDTGAPDPDGSRTEEGNAPVIELGTGPAAGLDLRL